MKVYLDCGVAVYRVTETALGVIVTRCVCLLQFLYKKTTDNLSSGAAAAIFYFIVNESPVVFLGAFRQWASQTLAAEICISCAGIFSPSLLSAILLLLCCYCCRWWCVISRGVCIKTAWLGSCCTCERNSGNSPNAKWSGWSCMEY